MFCKVENMLAMSRGYCSIRKHIAVWTLLEREIPFMKVGVYIDIKKV